MFTYSGENPGIPFGNAPNILNKSFTITAEIEVPKGGAEGMIVTAGGRFGGYGLYLLKGKPVFTYNLLDLKRTRWEGGVGSHDVMGDSLAAGKHTIVFDFTYDGPGIAKGGSGVLKVDGKVLATEKIEHTVPFIMPADETFDVGVDLRTPVDSSYQVPVPLHRQDRQADLQARAVAAGGGGPEEGGGRDREGVRLGEQRIDSRAAPADAAPPVFPRLATWSEHFIRRSPMSETNPGISGKVLTLFRGRGDRDRRRPHRRPGDRREAPAGRRPRRPGGRARPLLRARAARPGAGVPAAARRFLGPAGDADRTTPSSPLYLAYLAAAANLRGPLLWPAVVLHAAVGAVAGAALGSPVRHPRSRRSRWRSCACGGLRSGSRTRRSRPTSPSRSRPPARRTPP